MKTISITVCGSKKNHTIKLQYDRMLFVSVCHCPSGLSREIAITIAKKMFEPFGYGRDVVCFHDPYLMTVGHIEENANAIKAAYDDGKDVFVYALNCDYLPRISSMHYRNRNTMNVSYYCLDIVEKDGDLEINVVKPRKAKKGNIDAMAALGLDLDNLYDRFIIATSKAQDMIAEDGNDYWETIKNSKGQTKGKAVSK